MRTDLLLCVLALTACGDRQGVARSPSDSTASMAANAPMQAFRQSDTMQIYMHVVKPGKAAEYERWVGEVWMPAIKKAGQKLPDVREMNNRQRMFKLTDKDKDGSTRYMWLFEPAAPASTTTVPTPGSPGGPLFGPHRRCSCRAAA